MTTPDGEFMTNRTSADVLQHTEILVLRQISDGLATTNRHLETLTGSLHDVRERVIRIEAQEVSKRLGDICDDVEENGKRCGKLEVEFARFRGLFLPLAVAGSALLTGAATIIVQRLFGG